MSTKLVYYDAARHAMQQARSVDEVKDVKDKAEALSLYAKQAKDTQLEQDAAEIKLRAVRRIGELSAGLETAHKVGRGADVQFPGNGKSKEAALADAGISTSAAHRYEQVAAVPEATFEAHIAEHRGAGEPVTVAGILRPHVAHNSGTNEWYTPPAIIAAAREVMGSIDLDPASSDIANLTVQAARYFTAVTDGLAQTWSGTVWLNPPYAQPLVARFCEKLELSFAAGGVTQACLLVNNASETGWFQRVGACAAAICFLRGRVKYLDATGVPANTPLQGQAVLYFGDRVDTFSDRFGAAGLVLVP